MHFRNKKYFHWFKINDKERKFNGGKAHDTKGLLHLRWVDKLVNE